MAPTKPAPWRAAFLRGLARGLTIARAAREAGIDRSSAHRVRQHDPAFAAAWHEARERGAVRLTKAEPTLKPDEVLRRCNNGKPKISTAGAGRWSAAKEQLFLEELAATGNITLAAKAAGVSNVAVYKRKAQWPGFAGRWRAALEEGWERVDALLMRTAADTLDPGLIVPGATPAMSIDQAITLWKAHRAEVKGEPDPRRLRRRAEPSIEEVRAEVLRRVRALGPRPLIT